jgi:hypothetical protein
MMSINHNELVERLSEYLDGTLEERSRGELEAHLSECGNCREVLEELRAVVAGAAALGPVVPERDLWPGIAAAIGTPVRARALRGVGDVIELPTARPAYRTPRGLFLSLPQLAAAGVALALATAALTWTLSPAPVATVDPEVAEGTVSMTSDDSGAPPELAAELTLLEGALDEVRARLDPNTVRILEKNLGVIERAIAESLLALEQDPANEYVRAHLERTYRAKADYLREATRLAEWAS